MTVQNISNLNPRDSPNTTDGINPKSCLTVRISGCHIEIGDDCITLKSGTQNALEKIACEIIIITNCTLIHSHGAVVLGSEMSGDIRNMVMSDCIFEGTDRGIRLKSRRERGGVIEDIRINNFIMKKVICRLSSTYITFAVLVARKNRSGIPPLSPYSSHTKH